MNLKSGIIIIGSLIWDKSDIRKYWRKNYLNENSKIIVDLPIRYGRISASRMNTYTMVYSTNLSKSELGKGIILELKNEIDNIKSLREILENSIRVERDINKSEWECLKKGEAFTLNWSWGVVGLCINPKHIDSNMKFSSKIERIVQYWNDNLSDFDPKIFSLTNERIFIEKNGQFQIEWTKEMDGLDFLFTTIVAPKPEIENNYPDADQIALKMYEFNYYSYFIKNVENNISTKDDVRILELIKSKYSIKSYIEAKIQMSSSTNALDVENP